MSNAETAAKARQGWEDTVLSKALARSPERKARFETSSGIEIKRVYTDEDAASRDYR